MIALVEVDARKLQGSNLPATVVAEFELDSVNPPPDMIEEVRNKNKNITEASKLMTRGEPSLVRQLNTRHK